MVIETKRLITYSHNQQISTKKSKTRLGGEGDPLRIVQETEI